MLFLGIKIRWQINCTRNLKVLKNIICVPESIITRKLTFKKTHNSFFSEGLHMDAQMHQAGMVSALYANRS